MPRLSKEQLESRTPRVCLSCNRKFRSTGPGNRICPACHRDKDRDVGMRIIYPSYITPADGDTRERPRHGDY